MYGGADAAIVDGGGECHLKMYGGAEADLS